MYLNMFFNLNKINLTNFIETTARVFISSIFINALPTKIFRFKRNVDYISSTGIPEFLSPFLLVCSIALIIIGTFMFVFRKESNLGPILLLVFLIPTTLVIHVFSSPHMGGVTRNLVLIGGLIITLIRK